MKPEQKHNLGHQTSLPVKEREQKQRSWKKSISDSASSGGATRQTGATTSQRETDHHESSDPSTVPSDTQTWQEIRTLRPFIKQAKLTDKVLGQGAYGSVIEVEVKGEIYAGKKLRADACSKDPVKFRKQFYTEYQVLDKLEHDHIVRYLGLAIMPDSDPPFLIMERLMTNLEVFIINPPSKYGAPNFPLKLSFLTGIADGLSYLHSKGVIHRNLTATNILLDRDLVAKISDFGNSAIVDIEPTSHLQTKSCVPGTLSYMPPEACDKPSRYNNDVFSFGHLSLFVVTEQQMDTLLPFKDRKVPGGIAGRSEVERRREYIDRLYQIIEREHPLDH
jgi:serine/threonine protein kinase